MFVGQRHTDKQSSFRANGHAKTNHAPLYNRDLLMAAILAASSAGSHFQANVSPRLWGVVVWPVCRPVLSDDQHSMLSNAFSLNTPSSVHLELSASWKNPNNPRCSHSKSSFSRSLSLYPYLPIFRPCCSLRYF